MHLCSEICPKVKHFLRLSHLYLPPLNENWRRNLTVKFSSTINLTATYFHEFRIYESTIIFLTNFLLVVLRMTFFLFQQIYFFQFLFRLLFPFSIWTSISTFNFPFLLIWTFVSLFYSTPSHFFWFFFIRSRSYFWFFQFFLINCFSNIFDLNSWIRTFGIRENVSQTCY